jgi:hypothetical protein
MVTKHSNDAMLLFTFKTETTVLVSFFLPREKM